MQGHSPAPLHGRELSWCIESYSSWSLLKDLKPNPLCPTIYRSTPSLHGYGEALQRWMMLEMDATYLSIECGPKGPPYLYLGPRPGKVSPSYRKLRNSSHPKSSWIQMNPKVSKRDLSLVIRRVELSSSALLSI